MVCPSMPGGSGDLVGNCDLVTCLAERRSGHDFFGDVDMRTHSVFVPGNE